MSWRIYDTERILQIQHEEALEDAREEGIQQGRAEAEHTIFLLKEQIKKLEGQLAAYQ